MKRMNASMKESVGEILRECISEFESAGRACRQKLEKLGLNTAYHSDLLSIIESLECTSFEEEFDNAGWTYVVDFR